MGKIFTRRATFEKKIETEAGTDWKSKKKQKKYTFSDVLFSTENQSSAKKGLD